MSYTQPTDEMIAEARHANLCDYFRSNGYDVEQRRDELHVKGFGGLYINTETNEWYCFSQADKHGGRNAVNCLTEILGMDFKTAGSELAGYLYSRPISYEPTTPAPKKCELVLPERADNEKRVFAYLCQTRKIDSKIVSDLIQAGLLYQDKRGNAVFLHKDENGQIVGAEIQGTNTYKRFKGVAAGTAYSVFSFKIGDTMSQGERPKCGTDAAQQRRSLREPNRAYIFESAIDLLSFKMLANQQKIQNSVLVSMAGLKPNSLKSLADRGFSLCSCVDNDEAGIKFTSDNGLIPCNRILSENGVKDFNELLQLITHNREIAAQNRPAQTEMPAQTASKSVPRTTRPRH